MLQHLRPTNPQIGRAKVLGYCCLFGDDLGYRAVVGEGPWLPRFHVAGSGSLFDDTPPTMRWEADDRLTLPCARTTHFASCVGVARRAYREPSSRRCTCRQGRDAIAVFTDRLYPFPLAAPERSVSARVGFGKDGDDRCQVEVGESVGVPRVVAREVQHQTAFDRLGDKAPV